MPDKPKQPPAEMTKRLAEHVRKENREGKREPDPRETRRQAGRKK